MIIYIIIIIIIIFNFYNINNIKLIDINKYIKTGDIILFKYNKIDFIHKIISPFTHIGIIILYNNKSYILETHTKGDTKYMGFNNEGVNIYNLYDRLHKYNGTTYLLKLKNPLSNISINKLINNIPKYFKIPYITNYKQYYFNNCIMNQSKIYNGMICSEFIYYILQDIIYNNNNLNYKCIKPNDFLDNDLYDNNIINIIN